LAIDAPENTLLAFLKALALGATYLETDVRSTRDGVAIICHDPDLIRVAKRNVKVSDLTLKELRAIDLGEGQTFCTLAEVLEAFPDVRLNIDVKSLDAARPAAAAIPDNTPQRLPAVVDPVRVNGGDGDLHGPGRVGLVAQVVAPEELLAAADAMVDRMLLNSPLALRLSKLAVDAPEGAHPALELLAQAVLFESPDKLERMTAFLNR